jgi:hypothetical protein
MRKFVPCKYLYAVQSSELFSLGLSALAASRLVVV